MSSPWQDTNTPDYGEPPSYGSTPPSHNVPASERTHLMSFGLKRKKYLGLIIALSVIGLIMFTVYGPYIMSGVASQRAKWNQELGERRAEEQIRRQDWEQQLKREQYQEEIKQSEERERWYNELEERRADEYSRADTWERQFKERKFRDEMRHEEEQKKLDDEIEERRAEERSKEAAWERQLKERKHEEQRRRDNWNERLHRARLREEEWERKWNQMQKTARRKEAQRQELERSREEQWQREEEERQSLGLYWEEPTVEPRCTAYNTRKYWARLLNTIPYDYNWLKPCQSMPMVFHGRNITTTQCHIDGDEVYGHWLVDFDEPNCTPYWDQFKDKVRYTLTDETLSQKYLHHLKDCTAQGSGLRRIEAHLEGIHDGEDGEKLCVSAPYDFYGQHYERPKSCVNWGTHGIFGIWEVDDPDCH